MLQSMASFFSDHLGRFLLVGTYAAALVVKARRWLPCSDFASEASERTARTMPQPVRCSAEQRGNQRRTQVHRLWQ